MPQIVARLEARIVSLEAIQRALIDDGASMVALARQLCHGAIRQGVSVAAQTGSRELMVRGGTMSAFRRVGDASERLESHTFGPAIASPLTFLIVAGDGVLTADDGLPAVAREVPASVAAVAGLSGNDALVTPHPATYRVDTLAVCPTGDRVDWVLLLGAPTEARTMAAAADVEAPQVAEQDAESMFPVARIVSRHMTRGLSLVEIVAPRLNRR